MKMLKRRESSASRQNNYPRQHEHLFESVAPSLVGGNNTFLKEYKPYIVDRWSTFYFAYDGIKAIFEIVKDSTTDEGKTAILTDEFELFFYDEIERVNLFLEFKLQNIVVDLARLQSSSNACLPESYFEVEPKDVTTSRKFIMTKAYESSLHESFRDIKDCEDFYWLNHYSIIKIAKKYEKYYKSSHIDFIGWKKRPSYKYFMYRFDPKITRIQSLRDECLAIYTMTNRKTYPSLAVGELTYVKQFTGSSKDQLLSVGLKLGAMLTMIAWLIWASFVIDNGLQTFWNEPALHIYTSIGNLLLFRFAWILCIGVWEKYEVNWSAVFGVKHNNPNVLIMLDELSTMGVIYAISFVLFFWANISQIQSGSQLGEGTSPIFLIVVYVSYELFQLWKFAKEDLSHGLYDKRVLHHLFAAPFLDVVPDFRDIFAADCLCSMTRVITDILYGACYVVTGSFLSGKSSGTHSISNFGNAAFSCVNHNMYVVASCAQTLPMILRVVQCYKKGVHGFWHSLNVVKYCLVICVVLIDAFRERGNPVYDALFYSLRVVAVLLLSFWDVHRDWGLLEKEVTLFSKPLSSPLSSNGQEGRKRSSGFSGSGSSSDKSNAVYHRVDSPTGDRIPHDDAGRGDVSDARNIDVINEIEEMHRLDPWMHRGRSASAELRENAAAAASLQLEKDEVLRMQEAEEAEETKKMQEDPRIVRRITELEVAAHIRPHPLLRQYLMYPGVWRYYAAMALNVVFRSLWVLSLSVDSKGLIGPQLNFFLASMEIVRRCIWGCLRVEKEHLRLVSINAPGFKDIRPPVLFNLQRQGGNNASSGKEGKINL